MSAAWPVIVYDGQSIPLESDSVDIVFSSNVLEHIRDVEPFQSEVHRVLKPGGNAVHVLPTSSWRFWTSITSFPDKIRRIRRASLRAKSGSITVVQINGRRNAESTAPNVATFPVALAQSAR